MRQQIAEPKVAYKIPELADLTGMAVRPLRKYLHQLGLIAKDGTQRRKHIMLHDLKNKPPYLWQNIEERVQGRPTLKN
jgi:hypothetical protein